jgi:hypothetical protein
MTPYCHKKTGKLYWHLHDAINKSCGMEGSLMAVYCPNDQLDMRFVRKRCEFEAAFAAVPDGDVTKEFSNPTDATVKHD